MQAQNRPDSLTAAQVPPEDPLARMCSRNICIVGVGNRTKGDDAAGPTLIDLLADSASRHCIDAGIAPENYLEKIAACAPDLSLIHI